MFRRRLLERLRARLAARISVFRDSILPRYAASSRGKRGPRALTRGRKAGGGPPRS